MKLFTDPRYAGAVVIAGILLPILATLAVVAPWSAMTLLVIGGVVVAHSIRRAHKARRAHDDYMKRTYGI